MSGAFFSDESIYDYAGFAILKGVTPYSGIALPQPPFGYLMLAGAVSAGQSSIPWIRTINLGAYLIGVLFVFQVLAKASQKPPVAFLGSLIYAVFPSLVQYPFSATLEFTYFTTLTFGGINFAFSNRSTSTYIAGVFFGLAAMTWYPGIFALLALLPFIGANEWVTNRSWRRVTARTGTMVAGSVSVVAIFLGLIVLVWKSTSQFLTQSLGLQTSLRAGFSLAEKLSILGTYVQDFAPILILAIVGMLLAFASTRGGRRLWEVSLAAWFLFVFALLAIVPRVLFPHYFWFLTPILGYFSAITIIEMVSSLRQRSNNLKGILLFAVLIASVVTLVAGANSFGADPFTNNVYNASEEFVGHYVANVSAPSQLIWTSEAGIAFYADRLIVPPNSSQWRIQGFFLDVFNTSFTDTSSFQHQGSALVSPTQFEQSWGPNVEVLVFIRGDGPVPYPDTLLWEGWPGTVGVSDWVMSHYTRIVLLTFPGNSYWYEVWRRD